MSFEFRPVGRSEVRRKRDRIITDGKFSLLGNRNPVLGSINFWNSYSRNTILYIIQMWIDIQHRIWYTSIRGQRIKEELNENSSTEFFLFSWRAFKPYTFFPDRDILHRGCFEFPILRGSTPPGTGDTSPRRSSFFDTRQRSRRFPPSTTTLYLLLWPLTRLARHDTRP